jgi:hypothetical protein
MAPQRGGLGRIFKIGHAFEEMQREAMDRSHSQNPTGKRYNEAYAALARPAPEPTKVNKTDRNQYIWCWHIMRRSRRGGAPSPKISATGGTTRTP